MIFAEITKRNYMSVSVTLKSYFYEVLIPSSQKNTSSPIEDILHHVSISFMKKLALYKCFNPRTHTGCDLLGKVLTTRLYSFQSTHPHGVRRSDGRVYSDDWSVSIHAPTRGATRSKRSGIFTFKVSIHAPTRGATARERQGHHI